MHCIVHSIRQADLAPIVGAHVPSGTGIHTPDVGEAPWHREEAVDGAFQLLKGAGMPTLEEDTRSDTQEAEVVHGLNEGVEVVYHWAASPAGELSPLGAWVYAQDTIDTQVAEAAEVVELAEPGVGSPAYSAEPAAAK